MSGHYITYTCMYTKHKTQKRKVWNDGFLKLHPSTGTTSLHVTLHKPAIDEADLGKEDAAGVANCGEVELPKHLVEASGVHLPASADGAALQTVFTKRKASLNPLLNRKFARPATVVPKPRELQQMERREEEERKGRRAPLQPGQLEERFYGTGGEGGGGEASSLPRGTLPPSNNYNYNTSEAANAFTSSNALNPGFSSVPTAAAAPLYAATAAKPKLVDDGEESSSGSDDSDSSDSETAEEGFGTQALQEESQSEVQPQAALPLQAAPGAVTAATAAPATGGMNAAELLDLFAPPPPPPVFNKENAKPAAKQTLFAVKLAEELDSSTSDSEDEDILNS